MSIYDFQARSIDGKDVALSDYRGHVLLIVNVASRCAFTPQYTGLESLYAKFKDSGFAVLGFPCNQFGAQEPGSDAEIKQFCDLTYKIGFPMFARIDVNGANAHPLFRYLEKAKPGVLGTESIKWNFTKFMVGRDGVPLKRYAPTEKPQALEEDIKSALAMAPSEPR